MIGSAGLRSRHTTISSIKEDAMFDITSTVDYDVNRECLVVRDRRVRYVSELENLPKKEREAVCWYFNTRFDKLCAAFGLV